MSAEKVKTLPGTSRRQEEANLSKTLSVIRRNIQDYGSKVAQMRSDINDMQAHFHDDNPELINQLENTYTMHDHMKRALERNERALSKPYFGRILFHDETYNKDESFYIGRGGIAADATHQLVIDWRAPVANAYYENGLGKCSYPSSDGKQIHIDLKLKRTYEIEDGQLQNYYDTEVISNDDLLTKYLAKSKQAVLGEIVATIQKEQNEIIRKSPYHNVIVQGVAGSGKTTVAMHRISYILYNYAERFKPDDFYIVGSNRILLNYITGVLPSLDVYGVRQMTMEQLFVRLLYEDWDPAKYCIKSNDHLSSEDIIKGSKKWFLDLEQYCNQLEWDTIDRKNVYLDRRQFVEGLRNGIPGVYDETNSRPASSNDLVLFADGAAVERYIRQNPSVSLQNKINMLNERLYSRIKDEFLTHSVLYTDSEKKAILRAYRGKYGKNTWKRSIFDMYTDFLNRQITRGKKVTPPETSMVSGSLKTAFDVYDLAALAYLYKRIKEIEVISEAHHVVIDEAQDFGMMAYSVLKFCIKDCTYTIMGDVSQNIRFGYGLNDWEELRALYLSDPMSSFGVLKKSYRNTVEISNYATRILHHGSFPVYPVEPIIRHGKQVLQQEIADPAELYKKAASVCRDWQKRGLETIAVICRNPQSAKDTAEKLGKYIELLENDLEQAEFGKGIMVLPIEYTKGLEFDAVLILNPSRDDYPSDDGHAKLLYVAATRALHELCILHSSDLTGLIADPVPERKNASSNRAVKEAPVPDTLSPMQPQRVNKVPAPMQKAKPVIPKKAENKTPSQTSYYNLQNVYATGRIRPAVKKETTPASETAEPFAFGDMPATEKLRLPGHARIDLSVRWVSKQPDGLYLQSNYGLLRISPITANIIRITFTQGRCIADGVHPHIRTNTIHRAWMYRESPRLVELVTDALCLQIDKQTGSISYMTRDKKLLLSERRRESRQMTPSPSGLIQCRLYLDWQKNEKLYGISSGAHQNLALKGSAYYISHGEKNAELPLLLSDKGYGILIASDKPTFCCDIPAYGSFLHTESKIQSDYYFLAGQKTQNILSAYEYLCSK